MFLTANELGLEDFLKAIAFIPPTGMNVEYFISPKPINGDTPGFSKEPTVKEYEDDSITYNRVDPAQKIVQADTPEDYAGIIPTKTPTTGPKPPVMPNNTPIESLQCPYAKVISDDETLGTDIVLTESFGPFQKNTLFHCKKLNENTLSALTPRLCTHYLYPLKDVPLCSYNGYGMNIQEVTKLDGDYWKIMGYIGGPYASEHVDVIYDEANGEAHYAKTRHVDVTHCFDDDKVKQFIDAFKRIVDIDTLKNKKTNTGMVQIPSDQSKELQKYCKEEIK